MTVAKMLVFVAAVALAQCKPTVTPVGGTDCEGACASLTRLGCPEAAEEGDGCVRTCIHIITSQIVEFSAACVVSASSVEAVRECPSVSCPK
jgi:hypothetical protein